MGKQGDGRKTSPCHSGRSRSLGLPGRCRRRTGCRRACPVPHPCCLAGTSRQGRRQGRRRCHSSRSTRRAHRSTEPKRCQRNPAVRPWSRGERLFCRRRSRPRIPRIPGTRRYRRRSGHRARRSHGPRIPGDGSRRPTSPGLIPRSWCRLQSSVPKHRDPRHRPRRRWLRGPT